MYHRDKKRWSTRFGSWVGETTVSVIVNRLSDDPATRVTPGAVYQWLAGHAPNPTRARKLVETSDQGISLDAIYAHRSELEGAP